MDLFNKVLEKAGLEFSDLNKEEQKTLEGMLESVNKNEISVERIRAYVHSMRDAVEGELSDMSMKRPSFWGFMFNFRRDFMLKARLRNYMLFEAFLDSPKKARKAIEQTLSAMGTKV